MDDPGPLSLIQMVILAIVQGATEFIPVSSSGHLVLVREVLAWSDEHGIVVDIILHASSLLAILVYFWRDWVALFNVYTQREQPEDAEFYRRLPGYLILATLPLVFIAPFLEPHMEKVRHADKVAVIMIATAVWFIFAERMRPPKRRFGWATAIAMGLIQTVALLPGASRSGLTTGAGLLMGLDRDQSAKFAFFMALPAISGAIIYEVPKIIQAGADGLAFGLLAVGFVVCMIVSLACIHFCLKFFKSHSLIVFSLYLFMVGTFLLSR